MNLFGIKLNWSFLTHSMVVLGLLVTIEFVQPNKANAQAAGALGCNATVNFSQAVPVHDNSTQALKNVKCTWSGIAWQMAHVVLHQLTTSVVNWINTGFQGSPSFVSNPETFFVDAADQATGVFIANTGPLAQYLCSPFSLDIRLSLALGQSQNYNQRYRCTLSTVIAAQTVNAQRLSSGQIGSVTVSQRSGGATIGSIQNGSILNNSGQLSVNGQSVNGTIATARAANAANTAAVQGFISGNFYNGGMPAFLALTTEPQNNPYGASLQAQSDLQMKILAKQNSTNNDLNRGAGFLSFQQCDTVATANDPESAVTYEQTYGNNPAITKKVSGNNTIYQKCHTETPGSVTSAALSKALGAPTDELNLTNDINQVVSALFSQLVTHVLQGGLLSSSKAPTGSGTVVTQSYINQLSSDPQLQGNFTNLKQQSVTSIGEMGATTKQASLDRDQALSIISAPGKAYENTRTCIANILAQGTLNETENGYVQSQLSTLDSVLSDQVTPEIATYQTAADAARTAATQLQDIQTKFNHATSANELAALSSQYSTPLANITSATDPAAAKAAIKTAQTEATRLQTALAPYQNICSSGGRGAQ